MCIRDRAEHKSLVGLPDLRWHFIGALQRNKVKYLSGRVACIESVGKASLAEEIDRRSRATGRVSDVLLSINVGREPSKAGFLPEQVNAALEHILTLSGVRVRGLMAIPPRRSDGDETRRDHATVRALRDELVERFGVPLPSLSLGMSSDYAEAIAMGSTEVRVGTAIFGPRPPRGT